MIPINSHVETIQRIFHKLDKLKLFDIEFLLVLEAVLSCPDVMRFIFYIEISSSEEKHLS